MRVGSYSQAASEGGQQQERLTTKKDDSRGRDSNRYSSLASFKLLRFGDVIVRPLCRGLFVQTRVASLRSLACLHSSHPSPLPSLPRPSHHHSPLFIFAFPHTLIVPNFHYSLFSFLTFYTIAFPSLFSWYASLRLPTCIFISRIILLRTHQSFLCVIESSTLMPIILPHRQHQHAHLHLSPRTISLRVWKA